MPVNSRYTRTYLPNGWLASQRIGNGAVTNYNYNSRGFMTDMNNNGAGGTLLSDFGSMTYDALGNRTAMTATIPANPALAGATSYSYDTRNELLNETSARNNGYVNNFGYDAAENPVSFKGSANTFNTDNQNAAFAFDGNGNPTTYKGIALRFDPENHLTSYGTTMTAGYDGDDLRAWKSTTSGKTYYVYDGDSPVLELNSSGTVTAFNVWGTNGLLSRQTGTTSVFYTFDPQGSVVQRLDGSQNILSTSAFDAWGNPLVPNPNDPFGYDAQWGYYTDNEAGLLLLTHRYYDPTQGRFLTRDPIGYSGGVNLYGYVGNGAIVGIDALGFIHIVFSPSGGCGEIKVYTDTGDLFSTSFGSQFPGHELILKCGTCNRTANEKGNPRVVNSHGPCPVGTYPIGIPHYSNNISYDPGWITIVKGIPAERGILIHGERGAHSYPCETWGCIRLPRNCMSLLMYLIEMNSGRPNRITISM